MKEQGPAPYLAGLGLIECGEPGYPPRTIANACDSDGIQWIGDPFSTGGQLMIATADALADRPGPRDAPVGRPAGAGRGGGRTLNIAGHREAVPPRMGA